ncbi:MAG: phosphatidylglycerophosphatase A [Acidobacteriota bacterium]
MSTQAAGPGSASPALEAPAAAPPAATGTTPKRPRRLSRFVCGCVATLFGLGYWPLAPGTLASLVTVALAWVAVEAFGPWVVPAAAIALTALGIGAAGRECIERSQDDPSVVVVDEAAGMLLALAFLPGAWEIWLSAFLLFRILDITKPWPADAAESLPGGGGVMADDLVCGLYTNLLLQIAVAWLPSP